MSSAPESSSLFPLISYVLFPLNTTLTQIPTVDDSEALNEYYCQHIKFPPGYKWFLAFISFFSYTIMRQVGQIDRENSLFFGGLFPSVSNSFLIPLWPNWVLIWFKCETFNCPIVQNQYTRRLSSIKVALKDSSKLQRRSVKSWLIIFPLSSGVTAVSKAA